MDNNKIYKGYWWLPAFPADQVAGTLTIDFNGNVKLELFGCFGDKDEQFGFEIDDESTIFGRCYDPKSNMTDVSLLDCRSAYTMNFSSTFPITKYSCRYALIGIHVESIDSAPFFKANIDFNELVYWCPPTNIITSISKQEISVRIKTAENEGTTKASVSLDDGTMLRIKEAASYIPNYPSVNLGQTTYLEIQKDNINVEQVLAITKNFERFMSLATLSSVEHIKIVLYSKQIYQELSDEKLFYHPIEMVVSLNKNNGAIGANDVTNYLFEYKDVVTEFGNMFKKLYTNNQIQQIFSNLLVSLEKKRVYTSNDFLIVAQALDGFAMRFRKEKGLLDEYTDLKNEFHDIRKLSLTDEDLKVAVGSRHYYSHILRLEKKDVKRAADGVKLYNLTKKLRVLLICCVLNFMGLSNEEINKVLNKCDNEMLHV